MLHVEHIALGYVFPNKCSEYHYSTFNKLLERHGITLNLFSPNFCSKLDEFPLKFVDLATFYWTRNNNEKENSSTLTSKHHSLGDNPKKTVENDRDLTDRKTAYFSKFMFPSNYFDVTEMFLCAQRVRIILKLRAVVVVFHLLLFFSTLSQHAVKLYFSLKSTVLSLLTTEKTWKRTRIELCSSHFSEVLDEWNAGYSFVCLLVALVSAFNTQTLWKRR